MQTSSTAVPETFEEAPLTLLEEPPRPLGFSDQAVLWGNLGITLTIPVAAAFVLQPVAGASALTLGAAVTVVLLGTVLGTLVLALSAVPGAQTGAPAMMLLRGLVGRRTSWLPTALNVAQCVGWAAVEIFVIAEGGSKLFPGAPRPLFVLAAGAVATALAVWPLGFVRKLRRYAVWLVLAATAYLFFEVLRHGLPTVEGGSWQQFWPAFDVVVALPISWAPLAADYARHSRSPRAAFGGAMAGFATAAAAYFLLGLLAIASSAQAGVDPMGALLAFPAGAVALGILLIDEIDEAFANLYSTALSAQNFRPTLDRRVIAVGVGAMATGLALATDIVGYESFLFLIGSLFIPLYAVLLVDYFLVRRGRWDVGELAPARPLMLLPWLAGFVAYQLLNPGTVPWWSEAWQAAQAALHFAPPTWLSASLTSFVVAGAATLVVSRFERRPAPAGPQGLPRS